MTLAFGITLVVVVWLATNLLAWRALHNEHIREGRGNIRPWHWTVFGSPLLYGPWLKRAHPEITR